MKLTDLPPSSKTILVIGPPGVGKTSLLMEVFSSGLAIMDCDNNITGATPYIKRLHKGILPDVEYFCPTIDAKNAPIPRGLRYKATADKLNEWIKNPSIKVIALDTLTSLVEFAMDEVRRQQGRKIADGIKDFIDDAFREQDWGAFKFLIKHLVITLKASGKTIVFCGHISVWEDKLTEIPQEFIAVPGSLKTEIASLFSEVWLMSTEEKRDSSGVRYERQIRIAPRPSQQKLGLKSAVGLANTQPLDIANLKKLLES